MSAFDPKRTSRRRAPYSPHLNCYHAPLEGRMRRREFIKAVAGLPGLFQGHVVVDAEDATSLAATSNGDFDHHSLEAAC